MTAVRVFRGLRLLTPGSILLLFAAVPGLLVAPMTLLGIIGLVLLVEAAKQPCQILGVLETFLDDRRRIGVSQNVFMEPTVIG